MSRVCIQTAEAGQLPVFSVLTRNERRHNNTVVSYTRYLEVIVFGHVIRLDRGKKVSVSGTALCIIICPDFQ